MEFISSIRDLYGIFTILMFILSYKALVNHTTPQYNNNYYYVNLLLHYCVYFTYLNLQLVFSVLDEVGHFQAQLLQLVR